MRKHIFVVAVLLVLCGNAAFCQPATVETAVPGTTSIESSAKTGRVLIIIPQYNFPDDEYTIPKVMISRGGFTVEVASQSTREIALGTDIIKVRPNLSIDQIDPSRYDALVLVGGYLSKKFYEDPVLIEKVKEFNNSGKLIGAMDNIPYFLAKWGLLKDVKVTINPSMARELKSMGVNYVDKDIVIDKNFITVDTFKYSDDFANEFLNELNNRNK